MDDRLILIFIYIIFLFTKRHIFFRIIYTGLLMINMYYLAKNKFNIKLKQLIIYILSYLASYYLIKDPNPFYYLFTFYLPMPNYFRAIFIIIFNTYIFNKYIIKLDTPKKIAQEEKKEEEKNDQKEINEPKKEDDDKNENTDNDNKNAIIKKGEEIKKEADDKDKEKDKSENKKEEFNKLFFLHYEIKYLLENKESLIWFFIYLILLRLGIYFYDIKYWVYFEFQDNNIFSSIYNTKVDTNNYATKENKTIYYISAVVYNMEPIIQDWISEMKQLIDFLGRDRVIVSIIENGDSTDKTRKYLNFFENYLINNKVVNYINTEKKEKKEGVDRIRFLAKLRNWSLDFLYRIGDLDFSNTKIIFINDVIFRYEDILKLIYTNNGNYDTVCAMDYYEGFYDTWASIGLDGKQFRRYFPFFYNKEAQDAYINGEVIRTFSCWNGINIINAKAFEDRDKLFFRTGTKIRQSECTLLHADMYWLGFRKIFVNTQVAVSYTYEYYYKNHYLYPWTKNLFTYFYYYFKYGFIKRNYNMTNLEDSDITMDNNLDQVVKEYMGRDY